MHHMFTAKKSLGQHFLTSKQVVFDLIRAAEIGADDVVVEVGPGRGFITEELVKVAHKVIAVEKDEKMVAFLKDRFAQETLDGKIEIILGDILSFSISSHKLASNSYKLVGAIPYYITGKLFRTFLELPEQPKTIAFIIQKEVAERIIAKDGKESLISLGVKAFGKPKYVRTVPRQFFSPPPKVSSALLVVENISHSLFESGLKEQWLFKLLRAGFAHKRKVLASSIREGLDMEKDTLLSVFRECGIGEKARPEDLSLESWACLGKNLKNQ